MPGAVIRTSTAAPRRSLRRANSFVRDAAPRAGATVRRANGQPLPVQRPSPRPPAGSCGTASWNTVVAWRPRPQRPTTVAPTFAGGATGVTGPGAAGGSAGGVGGTGGADTLNGDAGDDTVNARDGVADTIDCGPGADTAVADAADTTTSCETVRLPAAPPADPPAAPPAAPVEPQATPVPGPSAEPPAKVGATVVGRWGLGRRATTVFELAVKQIPAGGRVEVRCAGQGCPFARRTVAARRGTATLTKLFARRKLRRGAVLEVRITAPGMVGKVVRYTIRARRKLPRSAPLCLPPGAARPAAC